MTWWEMENFGKLMRLPDGYCLHTDPIRLCDGRSCQWEPYPLGAPAWYITCTSCKALAETDALEDWDRWRACEGGDGEDAETP